MIILATVLCLSLGTAALASDEIIAPWPDFYVTDNAGTLSDSTKELIINASGPLEQECSGAQICVVTINYLPQGMDAEQYAWLLMNEWGVGDKSANNGMLLLHVVMEDRGWLALGSGLSSRISTGDVNELLDEYFWPYSDAGRYDEAVATLFPHLIDVYESLYGVELYGGSSDGALTQTSGAFHVSVFVVLVVLFFVLVLLVFAGGGSYYRRRRYGSVPMFFFCGGPRGPRGPRPPFPPGGGGGFHGGGFGGGGFGGGFSGGGFGGGGHAGGGGGRR